MVHNVSNCKNDPNSPILKIQKKKYQEKIFFVRDGIPSVADYNSTLMGVVVVVVVVAADFTMG